MTFKPGDYLNRAQDSIDAAELLLKNGMLRGSLNRSYYGIFYCVQALVLSEGAFVKTHSGLKSKFHELFVKTGKIDEEAAKKYTLLFQERLSVDYDVDSDISFDDTSASLQTAKSFFEFTSSYFRKK